MKSTRDSNNTCEAWSDYTHARYGMTNKTLMIRTAIEMPKNGQNVRAYYCRRLKPQYPLEAEILNTRFIMPPYFL